MGIPRDTLKLILHQVNKIYFITLRKTVLRKEKINKLPVFNIGSNVIGIVVFFNDFFNQS